MLKNVASKGKGPAPQEESGSAVLMAEMFAKFQDLLEEQKRHYEQILDDRIEGMELRHHQSRHAEQAGAQDGESGDRAQHTAAGGGHGDTPSAPGGLSGPLLQPPHQPLQTPTQPIHQITSAAQDRGVVPIAESLVGE